MKIKSSNGDLEAEETENKRNEKKERTERGRGEFIFQYYTKNQFPCEDVRSC